MLLFICCGVVVVVYDRILLLLLLLFDSSLGYRAEQNVYTGHSKGDTQRDSKFN
jgi:hypothetical protein